MAQSFRGGRTRRSPPLAPSLPAALELVLSHPLPTLALHVLALEPGHLCVAHLGSFLSNALLDSKPPPRHLLPLSWSLPIGRPSPGSPSAGAVRLPHCASLRKDQRAVPWYPSSPLSPVAGSRLRRCRCPALTLPGRAEPLPWAGGLDPRCPSRGVVARGHTRASRCSSGARPWARHGPETARPGTSSDFD